MVLGCIRSGGAVEERCERQRAANNSRIILRLIEIILELKF